MLASLPVVLGLLPVPGSTQDTDGWKLARDKDGIRVYRHEVEGSAFDAVRGEMRVAGSLESALAVIWDVARYPEWMPHTDEIEILEKEAGSLVYYLRSDVPWPAADRDGVYEIRVTGDARSATVHFVCRPERLKANPGYVRIPSCNGSWVLERQDQEEEVQITYEMESEMGGNIPGWLANMGATNVPYRMMRELRRRMSVEPYRDSRFPFP